MGVRVDEAGRDEVSRRVNRAHGVVVRRGFRLRHERGDCVPLDQHVPDERGSSRAVDDRAVADDRHCAARQFLKEWIGAGMRPRRAIIFSQENFETFMIGA